jgi:DNA repair protein RadC
VFTSPK